VGRRSGGEEQGIREENVPEAGQALVPTHIEACGRIENHVPSISAGKMGQSTTLSGESDDTAVSQAFIVVVRANAVLSAIIHVINMSNILEVSASYPQQHTDDEQSQQRA
jgi:hypothetical protein